MRTVDAMGGSVAGGAATPVRDAPSTAAERPGRCAVDGGLMERALVLLAPGDPPRGWTARATVIMAGTITFAAALAAVGIVMRGDPGAGFQEEQPGTWASAGLMLWAGALSVWAWARSGRGTRRAFWVIAAVGLAYLAVDDLFWIHERLDEAIHRMLGWNVRHPVTDHLDDVIVLGYGLIAVAVLWHFRRDLLELRWFVLPLIAAACCFAAMVVMDVTRWGGFFEEGAKLLGAACIVCAVYGAVLDREGLRRLGRDEGTAP